MDLLALLPTELQQGANTICRIAPNAGFVACAFLCHHQPRMPEPSPARSEQGLYGLSLAIAGSAVYVDMHGQRHQVLPGTIFQFSSPPGPVGRLEPQPGFLEATVCFHPDIGYKLLELGIWNGAFLAAKAEPSATLLQRYLDLYRLMVDSPITYDQALRGIIRIVDLAYAHAATASGPSHLMAEACRLLGERVDPRNYSARHAARDLGLPYDAFRRMFARHAGMPPHAFQQRKRMELACAWLHAASVKEVAARLGYSSPFLFSRQFKKIMGVSPKTFKSSGSD